MKRIIIYTALLSAMLSGCNLDFVPNNALTYTNAFNTEKELNATTASIHFYLDQAIDGDNVFLTAGVVADELQTEQGVREWSPVAVINQNEGWTEWYNVIFESNLLLDNIHRTEGLSDERRNYHRGQALFAKGFAYLKMAMKYGDAIVTTGSTNLDPYGLSPMLDVIDEAIKSGEEALEVLPIQEELRTFSGSPVPNKMYASKGAAAALLAHAYAWKGSMIDLYQLEGDSKAAYAKAVEYVDMLTEGKVGNYQLYPTIEGLVAALSNADAKNMEDIYVIAFDRNRSLYSISKSPANKNFVSWPVDEDQLLGDLTSNTSMRIYKETILEMYPDESDDRKTYFFYELDADHEVDGTNYALMHKYNQPIYTPNEYSPSGKDWRSLNANYNYWRLGGLILLRAECLAKLGRDGEATRDLNTIRERANATPYPADYDNKGLQYAIFKERERELIYESDHRYFDVVRNNYIKTELNGKFRELTNQEIKDGALFLPITDAAFGKDGRNTLIRQKKYWIVYK